MTEAHAKPASLGVQLLADIRQVFNGQQRMSSTEILLALHDMDTAPWASLKGEPIDARFLARTLSKYEIEPRQLRIGPTKVRGYTRGDFLDAWERYCPSPSTPEAVHAVQPVHPGQEVA